MTEQAAQVDELQKSINESIAESAEPAPESPVETEAQITAESAPANEEALKADQALFDAEGNPVDLTELAQKRINKVTADKYEQQRRADALEQELKTLRTQQPVVQPESVDAPTLEQFDFDDAKYQEALINHQINQRMQVMEAQQQQSKDQEKANQISQSFNEKVAVFVESTPDYAEVVGSIPKLPDVTLEAIMQMDNGPQVAHFLGKHLDVADEIATASPMMAAMRLGEIRSQLANNKPNKKPSAAPEPVETITSGGGVDKDIGEMSMEEIYGL